jgi:hypothetical protein
METLPIGGATLDVPRSLGPYALGQPLGVGGMGIVYRAKAPDGGEVAVKTIVRASQHALASLRAELHALRRVRHDGIVQVFDDGIEHGWPWFAMELLTGESFATYAQRTTRKQWSRETLRPVLRLVYELCAPLAALHDSGIVHRDLKPENLFIRANGTPVIVDLGLARNFARGGTRAVAEADAVAGTYSYMAPEQRTNELVDARTDLYSLGCILFELLVGHPPPRSDVRPPSQHVEGIPPMLDALVMSLLQPRARDRIGHAEDVRAWIAAIIDQTGPASARPTTPPRLFRPHLSGRRDALRQLRDGLDRARERRGQLHIIEGESGIGKTHLASELARLAIHDCYVIPVISERADSAPRAPLASWGTMFEHAMDRANVAPSSPVAAAIQQHRELLVGLHRAFAPLEHTVVDRDSRPSIDKVLVAVADLLGALAAEKPTLVLLDDLQWADELTQSVLRLLTGSWLDRRPVMLLATLRTDEVAPLELKRASRIVLGPLPDADLRELVADMLGVGEPPEPVVEWISRRAEGNPYLAAEYLRLVLAEVPLDRELALPAIRVRAPSADRLEQLSAPRSVHDLVMRRIDPLDPAARRLAELVAVLGGVVDADVLSVLEEEQRDAVFDLNRRQILDVTDDGGARLLHDRMRTVVYAQLTHEARAELHGVAARLLIRASASDPRHGQIGRHFVLAGERKEALPHLEQAAELALSRAAYDTAARHFADARTIALELGIVAPRERRARLSLGAARASYGLGDMNVCEDRVRDALALVGRDLPRGRAGWVRMIAREMAARFVPAHKEVDPVLADASLAASILPYRFFFEEDLVPLVATALLSANLAERGGVAAHAAGPMSLLAAMAGLFRMPRVARRYFDRAQTAAVAASDWREATQAYALESIYLGSFARWDLSEACAKKAIEYCIPTNDPWLRVNAETAYSHLEYFTGRFEDAYRRAVLTEQLATERNNVQHAVWGHYLQSRSDIPRGRWAIAQTHLEAALAGLATHPEMISEVACHGMLARVRYAQGDVADAEHYARTMIERVKTRVAPAYPSMIGYLSASRVLCDLVERQPSPERWKDARELGVAIWRFAAIFPVALPGASLHLAQLLRIAGHTRIAHRVFIAGARRAARSGQPYERAHLLWGAAKTTKDRTTRDALAGEATAIAVALGCHEGELVNDD